MAPASPDPGTIVSVADRLIRALPPAFVLLVVINLIFLGCTAWLLDRNSEARNAMLARIIDRCLITPK